MVDAASDDNQLKTEDTNKHVVAYLRYYCDPDKSFDFAVMLKGPWGVGKSYLIKKFLAERPQRASEKKDLYVSLYGITSSQQIDDALYKQLHPTLSSKRMRFVAEAAQGVLKKATNIDLESGLRSYFDPPKGRILIFDDLERCSMPISDALGYINYFVEQHGCKVIILANEEQILSRQDSRYSEIKEKLIGQTLEVHSTAQSAIEHFLDLIGDDKTRKFLNKNIDEILSLHSQSDTNNLRLLKQSLWEFERLADCFSEKHWANDDAMRILFRVLLALSFETRSGRLKAEQFAKVQVNRIVRHLKVKDGEAPSIADELEKRYPETSFDQTIVSSALLKAFLFDGWADPEMIRAELDRSPYYAAPGTEPAWRTAWRMSEIDDGRYEEAVAKVEEQFKNREFEIPGEMFHVFGLRLFFSEIGVITIPKIEVVRECKQYVDSLHEQGRILNKYTDEPEIDRTMSWQGLVFVDAETNELQDILSYYRSVVDEVTRGSLPALGLDLLSTMKNNSQKYFRMLCINNFEGSVYYNVPVLAEIPENDFVAEVLKLDANSQSAVFAAFRGRYQGRLLETDLMDEKKWLGEVKRAFEEKAKVSRPLSRHRILSLVKRNIDPFLGSENVSSKGTLQRQRACRGTNSH